MSGLFGFAAHRTLPKGENIGAIFWHAGEKYYVTQAEMDRVKSMPSAEKAREMVANMESIVAGRGEG